MQTRDRIILEIAQELGIPQKIIQEVVSSQTDLARQAMQNKEATSVYLRKVGTFISPQVKKFIIEQRIKNKNNE